jgi:O-antigen/teichoic acid export membrane protein
MAWFSFFALIGSMGIDSAITYFISSGKVNASQIFPGAMLWILICLIGTGAVEYFYHTGKAASNSSIPFGSLTMFIFGQLLLLFLSAFYFGQKKFVLPSIVQFFGNIIFSGLCLFHFYSSGADNEYHPTHLFYLYPAVICLQAFFLLFHFLRKHHSFIQFKLPDGKVWRLLFSYCGLALLANLLFFAYQRADYWIISKSGLSPAELGNYIQASRFAQLFQILPTMLAGALFPMLSSLQQNKQELLLPLMRISLWLNILFLGLLALSGSYLFPFLFGPSFDLMYICFLLLIPGILSLTLLSLLSAFFASENRLHVNLYAAALAMLLLIGGDTLLLKKYGLMAASLVNSVSAFAAFILSVLMFKRHSGVEWKKIFLSDGNDFRYIRAMFKQSEDVVNKERI